MQVSTSHCSGREYDEGMLEDRRYGVREVPAMAEVAVQEDFRANPPDGSNFLWF